jgi:hypothetical protein
LAWSELTTLIEANESFNIHSLNFAKISLKISFELLDSLCGLEDVGYRTRRAELGLGIWHIEERLGEMDGGNGWWKSWKCGIGVKWRKVGPGRSVANQKAQLTSFSGSFRLLNEHMDADLNDYVRIRDVSFT